MKKNTSDLSNEFSALVEDADALMRATADVAGERVGEARKRLANALNSACEKSRAGVKAADDAVRENPYQAIAIGVGVGAVIGFFLARKWAARRD